MNKKVITKEGITFFYTNADQFVNKRDELNMVIVDDKPDVMFITEVIPKKQINPIIQKLLDIEGYNCLLNFDPEELNLGASGIRGVAIYTRKSLKIAEIDFKIDYFQDHIWIEIPAYKQKPLLCGCIYRSPSNDSDSEGIYGSTQATRRVIELIRAAYQHNSNLLIAGDFNYKEIDWKNEYAPPGKKASTGVY